MSESSQTSRKSACYFIFPEADNFILSQAILKAFDRAWSAVKLSRNSIQLKGVVDKSFGPK